MKFLTIAAALSLIASLVLMATTAKPLLALAMFVLGFCCIGILVHKHEIKSNAFHVNSEFTNKNFGVISGRSI